MELKIPPPLVALVSAGIMWLVSEGMAFATLETVWRGPLSLGMLGIGLVVELFAVFLFLKARTTVNPLKPHNSEQLVVEGIYRFTRNPMYLGTLLLLSSWAVWLGNLINIAVLAFFIWYVTRFQIIPEERVLRALFTDRYEDYCSRVRRWL